MSEVLKNIELIESYCEGKLSAVENTDFETRLLIDGELKEEFELYKKIVAGLKQVGEENLRAKFKLADNELDSSSKIIDIKKPNIFTVKYLAIAASVIFIISIGLFWTLSTKINLPGLADVYYEKEKGLPVVMSDNKNEIDDIMNSYKSGDYGIAKNHLVLLLERNKANDTLNYFYGVVNYELADYKFSEGAFNKIDAKSSFYDKAQYRLILIDLKTKNKASALRKINSCLLNKGNLYYDKLFQLKAELTK